MEGTTHTPPTAGISSKQFPQISNEEKHRQDGTRAGHSTAAFPRSLLGCFTFFSKNRESSKAGPAQEVPERKVLRTSTISALSMSRMKSSIEASPYKWPHDSSFDPKTTALVIIDMQKDCEFCFL
jgi:hypothetical protein